MLISLKGDIPALPPAFLQEDPPALLYCSHRIDNKIACFLNIFFEVFFSAPAHTKDKLIILATPQNTIQFLQMKSLADPIQHREMRQTLLPDDGTNTTFFTDMAEIRCQSVRNILHRRDTATGAQYLSKLHLRDGIQMGV